MIRVSDEVRNRIFFRGLVCAVSMIVCMGVDGVLRKKLIVP